MATDMTVAKTILQQLGGGTFKAMTGAKNFIGDVNRLTFRLPSSFALQASTTLRSSWKTVTPTP